MYWSHEIIQNFVHHMVGYEERAKVFQQNMTSGDFDLRERFFHPVSQVHT